MLKVYFFEHELCVRKYNSHIIAIVDLFCDGQLNISASYCKRQLKVKLCLKMTGLCRNP